MTADLAARYLALAAQHHDAAERLALSAARWMRIDRERADLDRRGHHIEQLAAQLSRDRAEHARRQQPLGDGQTAGRYV